MLGSEGTKINLAAPPIFSNIQTNKNGEDVVIFTCDKMIAAYMLDSENKSNALQYKGRVQDRWVKTPSGWKMDGSKVLNDDVRYNGEKIQVANPNPAAPVIPLAPAGQ